MQKIIKICPKMWFRADKKLINLRERPLSVFWPGLVGLPLIPTELQALKVVKLGKKCHPRILSWSWRHLSMLGASGSLWRHSFVLERCHTPMTSLNKKNIVYGVCFQESLLQNHSRNWGNIFKERKGLREDMPLILHWLKWMFGDYLAHFQICMQICKFAGVHWLAEGQVSGRSLINLKCHSRTSKKNFNPTDNKVSG